MESIKQLRGIPRVLRINGKVGFVVSLLFNNGTSKTIDFEKFLKSVSRDRPKHPSTTLLNDAELFESIEILEGSIGWKEVGIHSKDENGEDVFYPYVIDPIVLFDFGTPDDSYDLHIGKLIHDLRKKAKMTQEELAIKCGTTKHYISRLENERTDIELQTLQKIIRAGFGKELELKVTG